MFYTLTQLSERLGISKETLKNWCESGEIPCLRLAGPTGVEYVIKKEDVKKVLHKLKKRKKEPHQSLVWRRLESYFAFVLSGLSCKHKSSLKTRSCCLF